MKRRTAGRSAGKRKRARRHAPCATIREQVFLLLDDDLSAARRRRLRRHLEECPSCFSRFEFSRILKRAIRKKVLTEHCPGTLLLRIRNTLSRAR